MWLESAIPESFSRNFPELLNWVSNNEALLWWVAATSLLVLLGSLIVIPWILVRIPATYFSGDNKPKPRTNIHPVLLMGFRILRNSVAVILLVLGLAMLVLPGQGLLTLFLSVLVADFPGKYRLERWLISRSSVNRSVNWLRLKAGREPFRFPS